MIVENYVEFIERPLRIWMKKIKKYLDQMIMKGPYQPVLSDTEDKKLEHS